MLVSSKPRSEKSQLRIIRAGAFRWCASLGEAGLPAGLAEIGVDAFRASGLESFVAPESLRVVGYGAFRDCRCLKRARLNEGLETLGEGDGSDERELRGVFEGSSLETVELPSTLRRIEIDAFANCRNLRSVQLPERLEMIGDRSFYGCGLTEVVFPASVERIGERAFYGNKIRKVTFGSDSRLITVEGHVFGGND